MDIARNESQIKINSMKFAICPHWPKSKRLPDPEWQNPSREETGEGVHRREETTQSRITVWALVLHCVCYQYTKLVLVILRKSEIETLVSLKQLAMIVGRLEKLKRDNAMEFL